MKLAETFQVLRAAKQRQHRMEPPQEAEGDASRPIPPGLDGPTAAPRSSPAPSGAPCRAVLPHSPLPDPAPSLPGRHQPASCAWRPSPVSCASDWREQRKAEQISGELVPDAMPAGHDGSGSFFPRPWPLAAVLPRSRPGPTAASPAPFLLVVRD